MRDIIAGSFGIGLFIAIVLAVLLSPLVFVWSLNTLFPTLAIPYNIWTWLATLILVGLIKSKPTIIKKG